MRSVWIIGGIVVIGGIGWFYWHQRQANAAAAFAMPSDTYAAPTTRGTVVQSVTSPGTVASNLDVAIRCRASGEVIGLPFHVSDTVKAGDILIQLDDKDEQVVVDQGSVTLDQANSKLKEAQSTEQMAELDLATATEQAAANVVSAQIKATNLANKADRLKDLLDKKLASQEDYETAQTDASQAATDLKTAKIAQEQLKSQTVSLEIKKEDVELARQQVQLDTIALKNAKLQLGYTTVKATADQDGFVVSDLQIQMHNILSSATSIVGGTTSMTLSDLSHIFVLATVDESDIGGVKVGQDVELIADGFPGKHFQGKVVQIAITGVSTSNVVTFQVKIEVTSKNKNLLKPQMTTSANIVEATHNDVVLVPTLAVVRRGGKMYVTVQKPGMPDEDRQVQIGISGMNSNDPNSDDMTEIVSGVSEGEQVLVHKSLSANRWTSSAVQQPRPVTSVPGSGGRR